eukprot:GHVU01032739.1.p1 GENE.GHVU01032739.1~~GHVU01032739.1.p1  ORF type:complete len:315 (+),score=82.90 GHVU01032739.1:100-1044(+)
MELLDKGDAIKGEGNSFFAKGDFASAIDAYKRAAEVLREVLQQQQDGGPDANGSPSAAPSPPGGVSATAAVGEGNEDSKAQQDVLTRGEALLCTVLANEAQCHIKTASWDLAAEAAQAAVNTNPRHTKALFRLVTAQCRQRKFVEAARNVETLRSVAQTRADAAAVDRLARDLRTACEENSTRQQDKQLPSNFKAVLRDYHEAVVASAVATSLRTNEESPQTTTKMTTTMSTQDVKDALKAVRLWVVMREKKLALVQDGCLALVAGIAGAHEASSAASSPPEDVSLLAWECVLVFSAPALSPTAANHHQEEGGG